MELRTSKDCRDAYREILQGYTYVAEKDLYVKHFKEADLGYLDSLYKQCEKKVQDLGVSSERERIKFLKEEDYWNEQEEEEYLAQRMAVVDAYAFKEKLTDPEQVKNFKEEIKRQEDLLQKIEEERRQLVEPTVESFCDKKINESYVRVALFKDEKLKEPLYSKDEFDDVSFLELAELVKTYNKAISKHKDRNIKRIGICHFFLNAFLMADNDPFKFFGTNVLEMTVYQQNLFSKGKYNKYILEEGKEPPEALYEQLDIGGLDEIVTWFDTANIQIKQERRQQSAQMKGQSAQRGR